MGELTEKIRTELTAAMKARDAERLSTLRMLQSSFKYQQIESGHELSDEEAMAVIRKAVKQRLDSIEQFTKGNRPELADKEAAEIAVLMSYLPQQLSAAEVDALIAQAIAETGAAGGKDMGKVMGWLKPKVAGKADMGKLSGLIKAKLG